MRGVVVTGLGVLSAAGQGTERFRRALESGRPLGREQSIHGPFGPSAGLLWAPLGPWDPGEHLTPRALRKMAGEARAVSTAFLMACRDADTAGRPVSPERLGTYLGSGFGCMATTEDYLKEVFSGGMATASPFLFAESLANSPLGHVAILADARGPSLGFASGDASGVTAAAQAFRDIRRGRIDRALCGGYEISSRIMVEVLARLGGRAGKRAFVGDGVAALVLEEEEMAVRSGAAVLARITGVGEAGDPAVRPTDWSHDPEVWSQAHSAALAEARHRPIPLETVFLHEPGSAAAAAAERRAAERLAAEGGPAALRGVHGIFGHHAAAGGLSLAAAALECRSAGGRVLVSAGAWGGSVAALALESPSGSRAA